MLLSRLTLSAEVLEHGPKQASQTALVIEALPVAVVAVELARHTLRDSHRYKTAFSANLAVTVRQQLIKAAEAAEVKALTDQTLRARLEALAVLV